MIPDQDKHQPLDTLLDTLYGEVSEVPSFIAKRRLLAACKDFCQQSHYWREAVQTIPANPDRDVFPIMLPTGAIYAGKAHCYQRNKKLSDAVFSMSASGESIEFYESVDSPITVVVSLMPSDTAVKVPQMLIEKYGDSICYGAAKSLVAMPKAPWGNPNMIRYYESLYKEGVSKALRDGLEDYMPNRSPSHLNRRQTFY